MRAVFGAMMIAGICGPVAAQSPLTAEAFEEYATNRTLSYASDGRVFGTEQYLPGRRVVWAFQGEQCQYGRWYPQDEQICFVYETGEPQCWTFWHDGTGLSARFMNEPAGTELSEVSRSEKPLFCPGPQVGV
ncbi:hypothetical protein [Falsirhodobacter deserti]|uniref:hypothetical protein n=1 Tax=Falsirhodobacter deserti TaxID=1365611 RepID=UPI000FE2F2BA|nr:hypothetical protein [Falsirhodobacter deserti]